jgi:hypothetical protein
MSQWLSHELAQGLAFNAGSNFDPPKEVRGYFLQPDVSFGIGRMPFNKKNFPTLTTPRLNEIGGSNLFPNATLFPNLALHLRIGLPWRGDAYIRLADATTPPNYKISSDMTAAVQSNSYGVGVRQHFGGEEWPVLTLGAHYNHVRGRTHLKGKFSIDSNGFVGESDFNGDINWNINSFGLTAVVKRTFGTWTPFFGLGYNYATGSVRSRLELVSHTFLNPNIIGEGSERPEQNQARGIFGLSYDRPTWSAFANAELKALGQLPYRNFIIQFGAALPFDIGRGPSIFSKKSSRSIVEDVPRKFIREPEAPLPQQPRYKKVPIDEKIKNEGTSEFIFLR